MFEKRKITYEISELTPYINWVYFHYAWQLHDRHEQAKLQHEAETLLKEAEGRYHAYALCMVADANSDGDDIIIGGKRLPMLRQQNIDGCGTSLCLADFIRPAEQGAADTAGVFATTVDIGLETDFNDDDYMKMMMQLLADRLAEAAAEKMHEHVRKELWGYAPDENLTVGELHSERFQGIRPAVGYPSLPDTSLNFLIADLLGVREIGIRLTESGAMKPHASVSGLMISHPQARYFSIGKIGEDQLYDYAMRRRIPVEVMRKFLLSNLR
ncbi:MAG: vitamin B12 dependent-methionine synthase activation domain-containing protein [Prevotella sp.]